MLYALAPPPLHGQAALPTISTFGEYRQGEGKQRARPHPGPDAQHPSHSSQHPAKKHKTERDKHAGGSSGAGSAGAAGERKERGGAPGAGDKAREGGGKLEGEAAVEDYVKRQLAGPAKTGEITKEQYRTIKEK